MLSRNLTRKVCVISLLVVCGCIFLLSDESRRLEAKPGESHVHYIKRKNAAIEHNRNSSLANSDTIHALERLTLPYIKNGFAKLYDFNESDPRPVMNTFFSKRKNKDTVSDEDIRLLAIWKAAWSAAGWNPRVLNISHAKAHPNYTWAAEQLDRIPMMKNTPGVDHYNRLCFLRHFSMGAIGGGWLSDYDSIPFNMDGSVYGSELPNEGNITSYQEFVPSLVVASKIEWDRLAINLIYEGLNTKSKRYSDMMALLDLYRKGEIIGDKRLDASVEAIRMPYDESICNRFVNTTFMHFSHAMSGGNDRAAIIIETLRQMSKVCNESFVDLTRQEEAPVLLTSVM